MEKGLQMEDSSDDESSVDSEEEIDVNFSNAVKALLAVSDAIITNSNFSTARISNFSPDKVKKAYGRFRTQTQKMDLNLLKTSVQSLYNKHSAEYSKFVNTKLIRTTKIVLSIDDRKYVAVDQLYNVALYISSKSEDGTVEKFYPQKFVISFYTLLANGVSSSLVKEKLNKNISDFKSKVAPDEPTDFLSTMKDMGMKMFNGELMNDPKIQRVLGPLMNDALVKDIQRNPAKMGDRMMKEISNPDRIMGTLKKVAENIADEKLIPVSREMVDAAFSEKNVDGLKSIVQKVKSVGIDEEFTKSASESLAKGEYQGMLETVRDKIIKSDLPGGAIIGELMDDKTLSGADQFISKAYKSVAGAYIASNINTAPEVVIPRITYDE